MSSDIARGMIAKLQADRDRMDFLQSHGYSLRRISDLVSGKQSLWMVHLNYQHVASGRTARAAIDSARKVKVKP